jgi:hypothetical protein
LAIRWARNPLLAIVLLAALLSRALIPTGFMPGAGKLVICHGMAAAGSTAATHGAAEPKPPGGSPAHDGSSGCPFAASATSIASGDTALAAPTVVASLTPALPADTFVPRAAVVATRLPRGPPLSA